MLSHNETQLDSYNKSKPNTQGIFFSTQVLWWPIGSKKEFIVIMQKKVEQPLNLIFPRNIKIYC